MADKTLPDLLQEWDGDSGGLQKPGSLTEIHDDWKKRQDDKAKRAEAADRLDAIVRKGEKLAGIEPEQPEPDEPAELSIEDRIAALEGYASESEERRVTEAEERELAALLDDRVEQGLLPNVDRDYLSTRIKAALLTDDHFYAAAESRNDNPAEFRALFDDHCQRLAQEHHDAMLEGSSADVAAYRLAKSVNTADLLDSDHGYGDFSTMSDGDFNAKKAEVFQAAKEGRLR